MKKIFTLFVAALFCSTMMVFAQEDERTVVNEIVLTTTAGDWDAQFAVGDEYYSYNVVLNVPESAPYITEYWNSGLYKWDNSTSNWDWANRITNGNILSEGKYLYQIRIRINGDAGLTHRFPTDAADLSASVDGKAWDIYAASLYVGEDQSHVYIQHEFELTDGTPAPIPTDVAVSYLDKSAAELDGEDIVLNIPVAPEIDGFTFLRWDFVAGAVADGLKVQAVYKANSATEAPSVVVNPVNPAQKLIRNGNVYILTGDKTYTITGQEVK